MKCIEDIYQIDYQKENKTSLRMFLRSNLSFHYLQSKKKPLNSQELFYGFINLFLKG